MTSSVNVKILDITCRFATVIIVDHNWQRYNASLNAVKCYHFNYTNSHSEKALI